MTRQVQAGLTVIKQPCAAVGLAEQQEMRESFLSRSAPPARRTMLPGQVKALQPWLSVQSKRISDSHRTRGARPPRTDGSKS